MENTTIQIDNSKEVAEIIYSQIGKKACFMLGVKQLVSGMFTMFATQMPGLRIKISGSKVSYVLICLNAMDTYNVQYMNRNGKILSSENMIYAEDLRKSIERNTGLYTNL